MNSVYRTPGRAPAPDRIPRPSLRTLLAPLGRATGIVALVAVAVAVFQAVAPAAFGTSPSGDVRFIPLVDGLQDGVALLLPTSVVLLVVLIARRVRPSWRGMRVRGRVLYVAAAIAAQLIVVAGAEVAIFTSRGGLHLFEPTHLSSRWLPDGRTAHLYTRGGLQCGYDVLVSPPLSFTAKRTLQISRATCLEPTPTMHVNGDGTIDLRGPEGATLESQPSPRFWLGGGC